MLDRLGQFNIIANANVNRTQLGLVRQGFAVDKFGDDRVADPGGKFERLADAGDHLLRHHRQTELIDQGITCRVAQDLAAGLGVRGQRVLCRNRERRKRKAGGIRIGCSLSQPGKAHHRRQAGDQSRQTTHKNQPGVAHELALVLVHRRIDGGTDIHRLAIGLGNRLDASEILKALGS